MALSFYSASSKQIIYYANIKSVGFFSDSNWIIYHFLNHRMSMGSICDLEYQGRNLQNYMGTRSWRFVLHVEQSMSYAKEVF